MRDEEIKRKSSKSCLEIFLLPSYTPSYYDTTYEGASKKIVGRIVPLEKKKKEKQVAY